jgi:putative ABC transport system permease protein
VTSAAFVSGLPLAGESQVNSVVLDGAESAAVDPATRDLIMVNVRFVSTDYFRTMGIPLVEGRPLDASDMTRRVAVVSSRLARNGWPGASPLGRSLSTGSGVGSVEVVGVVGDVPNGSIESGPTPIVYVPLRMRGPVSGNIVTRGGGEASALVQGIRQAVRAIDPGVPLTDVRSIEELVSAAVARRRFQVMTAAGFAAGAVLLTLLGIYGVVAYGVAQRRSEMGIRMALGASTVTVTRTVMATGLRPVAAGLLAGVVLAFAGGRFVESLLFGIQPADPVVIGGALGLLAVAAVVATLVPSLSAARVDPLRALRGE